MSQSRDRAPSLSRVALLSAGIAGFTGLWLVLLQNASAAAAGKFWIIDRPWLNLLLYPLLLGIAGGLGGGLLELVRRLCLRRVDPWAWAIAWASLGGYALRAAVTAASRVGERLPGGTPTALAAQSIVVLMLVALALWLLTRRPIAGFAEALRRGVWIVLLTLGGIYLFHAVFLTDRHQVSHWGLLGLPVFAISAATGVVGIGLGVALGRTAADRGRPWGRYAVVGGLVLLLALALQAQNRTRSHDDSRPVPDGPNVLLVVLDTLRRDAVSAYGVIADTTPHLDEFARQGVLWEDAIAPGSWTIPSHASLFTGAVVSRHGAGIKRKKLRERPGGTRSPRLPTLAEVMHDRGWHTAAFVNNGQINRAYAYDRGFLEYYEMWTGRTGVYDTLGEAFLRHLNITSFDKGGAETNRALAAWFAERAQAERPAFCFVNYVEPHAPYDSPLPWRDRFFDHDAAESNRLASWQRKNWRAAQRAHQYGGVDDETVDRYWRFYLGAVAYQDHIVGEMLDALEASGLAEDTVVIFTSDHGENFGWRGQLGHGWELNDDLIRVPLLARGPGVPVGVRDATPASLIDIFPTVLYLTGGDPTTRDPGRPGIVLPPIDETSDGTEYADRLRVAERYRAYLADVVEFNAPDGVGPHWAEEHSALLSGPWKAVHIEAEGRDRLTRFDDPFEPPSEDGRTTIDDPDRLASMVDQLAELRSGWTQAEDPSFDDLPALDEEARQQLRALGYLD